MRTSLLTVLVLSLWSLATAQSLTKSDRTFLDQLLANDLYRPTAGQQYVVVRQWRPTCWGDSALPQREGWLSEEGDVVYFTDGESATVGSLDSLRKVDFAEWVQSRELETETFGLMRLTSIGVFPPSELTVAAWFHALGEDALAARHLERARKAGEKQPSNEDLRQALRNELAWSAYSGLVHCYMVRRDSEALAHAQRFRRLYADDVVEYAQFEALEKELERRKVAGTFNSVEVKEAPAGFDSWDWRKQLEFLIGCLDEVDQRQDGQPGGVSLAMDWRVQALIAIGDSAVPRLIDVVETDRRFTRSVHFWRDFSQDRTVLNVKEAALTAIMSIWQDPLFEPVATGDNFTSRGEAAAQALATQLRAQAEQYKGSTLDQRKLEVMLDATAESYLRADAALELARFGYRRNLGTTVWSGRWVIKGDGVNPLVKKYSNPTLAEMIWNVMQEELVRYDREKNYTLKDQFREVMEVNYLGSLIELNDPRILPMLRQAYADSTQMRHKRQFAYASYFLGDSSLWEDYCGQLAAGAFTLPPIVYQQGGSIEYDNPARQPGNRELTAILSSLENIGNAVSMETLHKLTRPGHPFYPWIEKRMIQLTGGYGNEDDIDLDEIWYHPAFSIEVLTRCLDDTSASDIQLRCYDENEGVGTEMDWGGQSGLRLHSRFETLPCPADSKHRARVCDMAAHRLYQLIFGIPACHGLMQDKDERIRRQKEFLTRFRDLRPVTHEEYDQVDDLSAGTRYIPALVPLDHLATQAEVDAGKALFTQNGEGRMAAIELPVLATLKEEKGMEDPMRVYIWQAELDAKGKLIYGALTEEGPKVYHEGELVQLAPLKKQER